MSQSLPTKWLPNIWEKYQDRNAIKSKHKQNLTMLKLNNVIEISFDDKLVSSLGEFAENKHYEVVETVKKTGYEDKDSVYKIHNNDDLEKIESMVKDTIWRIRIKNFTSFVVWFLCMCCLIFVPVFTLNITNVII